MECNHCGHKNRDNANFCTKCGMKLNDICQCWVKKEPYNCNNKTCPGYRLHAQLR